MNVGLGDTVTICLPGDSDTISLTINALADTNIGQGLFMSKEAWEACRKGDFQVTTLLITAPTPACSHLLEEMDEVGTLLYPAKQLVEMSSIMDSTTAAFTILSVAALALAFIICYNMGLMNFSERVRDYATLKVLGYHQKEIRRLIMRENSIISLFGVALGVWPGIALTDIIMHTCEPESGFYPGAPTIQSIVIACVVTYLFSQLLQRMLARKVQKIDMVEALKSVE